MAASRSGVAGKPSVTRTCARAAAAMSVGHAGGRSAAALAERKLSPTMAEATA